MTIKQYSVDQGGTESFLSPDGNFYQLTGDQKIVLSGFNVPNLPVSLNTPVDAGVVLQQAAADGHSVVYLRKTRDEPSASGYAYVGTQVFIPWYVSLLGDGRQSVLRFDNNSPSILFKLNTDNSSTWIYPFPATNFSRVYDLHINSISNLPTTTGKTIFEIGGPIDLRNLHVGRVASVVKQPSLLYIDSVRIERLVVFSPKYIDDNTWLVDLNYTGDTVEINQCHFYPGDEETPSISDDKRPRAIRLRFKAAATIRNIIGGDILIRSCKNVSISQLHHELGFVFVEDSTGELRNSTFWMRGAEAGELSGVPIQFYYATASTSKPVVWTTENISFVYQKSFPGAYPIGMANFNVKDNAGVYLTGVLTFRNLWRDQWSEIGGFETPARIGVTCGASDFDNYSHFASQDSQLDGRLWKISANFSETISGSAGIDVTSSSPINEGTWLGSTGTYYYKATLLLDKQRMIGLNGTAEKSFTLTNGSSAPSIVLLTDFQIPAMIRLYRGTSTGSYNFYVDVPLLAGGRLIDTGEDICGYAWISRTPAAVDTINNLPVVGGKLQPGEYSVASDAYGNMNIRVRSSATLPTVGAWRRGDIIGMESGPTNSAYRFVGWRRVTNCTKAATTNVLGTDWAEVWEQYSHPAASSTEFQSLTSTVNTVFKKRGSVWTDTTGGKVLQAMGSTAASVWADSAGTTVYTPV